MIVRSAEPSLAELIQRQNQPKRWKDGMAKLAVEGLRKKTAPLSLSRKYYIGSMLAVDIMEACVRKDRGYDDYNGTFQPYLKRDILDILRGIASSRKNRPLCILDDGAGEGNFLGEIKVKLAAEGIGARTASMSMTLSAGLELNKVDVSYEGSSVMVVPEERQDLIISNLGTLWYQSLELQKEIILKHAYTLTKGGYLLLMTSGIAANVKDPSPQLAAKVGRNYCGIRRSLEKRGFEVIHAGDGTGEGILIARRLK